MLTPVEYPLQTHRDDIVLIQFVVFTNCTGFLVFYCSSGLDRPKRQNPSWFPTTGFVFSIRVAGGGPFRSEPATL